MRQARLVGGVEKLAVRRPPVSFQHPRKPLAEHRRSIGEPASRRDAVNDNALPGEGPQPGTAATDPPAGLVRCDDRAGSHPLGQRGVGRLAAARRPRHRLDHPTRGDFKAELAEQPGDLAGRQPQPLVAPGGQRDRARADLDAGRAQRIRGLLGMAGLDAPPARPTAADRYLEPGDLGRLGRWEVLLVLVGHPFEGDRPAAGRAGSRQRYADHPVDPIRHRPARRLP
jgi:hypothetical protein